MIIMPRPSKQPDHNSPSRPHRSGNKQLIRNLSKDELLKRLKKLAQELMDAEQAKNLEDYTVVAESLGQDFIIKHADNDVRLYAAHCLADVLRIFAPNPPYHDNDQLWTIFDLIISQLEGLKNPKGSAFDKLFHILENLSCVNTLARCVELDFIDLVVKCFKVLFGSISDDHLMKVHSFMLEIMLALVAEVQSFPQSVLDAILENIIMPRKNTNGAAYKLACAFIQKASGFLEPLIQLFFSNSLFFGKAAESVLDEHIYELICELYRIHPSVLLAVLPQLEYKLKSEKDDERLEVTKLLGKMFSDEDSDLSQSHKALWQAYVGRFVDKTVIIRVEVAKQARYFLLHHPELANEIADKLCERQRDPDEKVRMEVVTTICEVASENIESVPDKLFHVVIERLRDRKVHIRKETIMSLGRLYKKICGSEMVNPKTVRKLSWIPKKIFHCYYQKTVEDRLCVERAFLGCLVPVTLGSKERMKRFLKLFLQLDGPAIKAFQCMFKIRASLRSDMNDILTSWEKHQKTNSESARKILTSKISTVAELLPDSGKTQEHLQKLVKMFSDKKLFGLLKACLNTEHDCGKVSKAVSAVVISIGAKNPMFEAVKGLLDRAAPLLIDASAGKHLIKLVSQCVNDEDLDEDEENEESHEETVIKAMDLLLMCSSIFPREFQDRLLYEMILINLNKGANVEIANMSLQMLTHVGEGLQQIDKGISSHLQQALSRMLTTGTLFQVKHAARAIHKILPDSSKIFGNILRSQSESLKYESSSLVVNLACMSQIALLHSAVFDRYHTTVIRDFAVKELLMKDRSKTANNDGPLWCDYDKLCKEVKAKIQALKLLVNWVRGLHTKDKEKVEPVLKALKGMLKQHGDLNKRCHVSQSEKSYLRLTAALGVLKLASESDCHEFIDVEFLQMLSSIVQDPCFDVRATFVRKLSQGLESLKLPLEYLTLFALAAKEPSNDRKQQIKQLFGKCIHVRNEYLKHHSSAPAHSPAILPEYALPYLIYLLSHLPNTDYTDIQSLKDIKAYLWFFLESVLTKGDNFNFVKKLAENVKLTKDARAPDNEEGNKAIYAVCDITISIILNLSKTQTFILKDFAGNLVLPKKLYTPLNKGEGNNKSYLPKNFVVSPVKIQKLSGPTKVTPNKYSSSTSTRKPSLSKRKTVKVSASSERSKAKKTQRSLTEMLNKKNDKSDENSEEEPETSAASEKSKAKKTQSKMQIDESDEHSEGELETREPVEIHEGPTLISSPEEASPAKKPSKLSQPAQKPSTLSRGSTSALAKKHGNRAPPAVAKKLERPTRSSPRKKATELTSNQDNIASKTKKNIAETTSSDEGTSKIPFDTRVRDTMPEKDVLNGFSQSSTGETVDSPIGARKRKNVREENPPNQLEESSIGVKRHRKRR